MKPSTTAAGSGSYQRADNNPAPNVRQAGKVQIIKNHPQLAKGPGSLGHNRGLGAVSMHSNKVDTNSPKSNKNMGQSC